MCPDCSKPLARKQHRTDKKFFWGCTGYPACTTTFDDKAGKPVFPGRRNQSSEENIMLTLNNNEVWKTLKEIAEETFPEKREC